MRVAIYSTRPNDREFLTRANGAGRHQLLFLEARPDATTVSAADGAQAVCVFVNDRLDDAHEARRHADQHQPRCRGGHARRVLGGNSDGEASVDQEAIGMHSPSTPAAISARHEEWHRAKTARQVMLV